MWKLLGNIGGVALACYVTNHGGGWQAILISIGMCVASNLVGLGQKPTQVFSKANL